MDNESITVSDADIDAAWDSESWTSGTDTPDTEEPSGGSGTEKPAEQESGKDESGGTEETPEEETDSGTDNKPESSKADGSDTAPAEPAAAQAAPVEDLLEIADGDKTRRVTRAEAAQLAAKGLKFDAQAEKFAEYESFVNDLAAASNTTTDNVMESVRASLIAKKDNISKQAALDKVRMTKRERELDRREKKLAEGSAKDESDKRRQAEFAAFVRDNPDVQAKDIPKAVWDAVRKGESLSSAYAKNEAKRLREENKRLSDEIATAKKNAENREKSAGSSRGTGKPSRDAIIDAVFAED